MEKKRKNLAMTHEEHIKGILYVITLSNMANGVIHMDCVN